jgi:hypothetical protein
MVRSTLVLAAALGAVSATGLADVASAATGAPIGAVTVTNTRPSAGDPVDAETVKKGARITGADRAKLAGELTKKY